MRFGRPEQTYFTFSYIPIRDGEKICGVLNVVNQTTEHVLRELALRASEERFRMLAAAIPHVVLEANDCGAVTFLSEAYTRYTGQPAATGLDSGWLMAVHPDDAATAILTWQRAIEGRQPFVADLRFRRHDGAYRWFSARVLPQVDADGEVLRWTGTLTDTHDVRRAVEEREILSEASRYLSESLDRRTTLRNIAQLTVPRIADWCQIDLKTTDGSMRWQQPSVTRISPVHRASWESAHLPRFR